MFEFKKTKRKCFFYKFCSVQNDRKISPQHNIQKLKNYQHPQVKVKIQWMIQVSDKIRGKHFGGKEISASKLTPNEF